MKKNNKRAYLPPILVAVLMLLYYGIFFVLLLQDLTMQLWLKLLLLIIPLALGGTVIHVLVQRIRELRSGETDDLHKY